MGTSLSGNKNCSDERIALGASLLLHAMLVLVLSSSSDFTPPLGSQTRIDLFWLTAAPEAPAARQTAAAPANTATAAALENAPPRSAESPPPEQIPVRLAGDTASPPLSDVFVTPGATPPALPRDEDGSRAMSAALPTAAAPSVTRAARVPCGVSPSSPPRSPATAVTVQEQAAPTVAAKPAAFLPAQDGTDLPAPPAREVANDLAPPSGSPRAVPASARIAPSRPGEQPAAPSEVASTRQTEGAKDRPATQETAAREPARPERELPGAAAIPQKDRELPRSEPAGKQRGMVVTSMKGDLKLVTAGDSVKISVAFRALPVSRRNRPPGRSEARRLQEITPVCATGPDGASEAVIVKAEEGVYIFSAEPRDQTAAQAIFTLKIYDSGAGKKVTALGRRRISAKSAVAKVLMPEAILWDDESAFTGSIEDSESTTKFNAQTGVYWKEYE